MPYSHVNYDHLPHQIKRLQHRLIISVQAESHEPLAPVPVLKALCHSVLHRSVAALRLADPELIADLHLEQPDLCLIGLTKLDPMPQHPESEVYITPTWHEAVRLFESGATFVATDATRRPRPDGSSLKHWVEKVRHSIPNALLWADVSTLEDGLEAAELGFNVLSTTLSGYTKETQSLSKAYTPDFELLCRLVDGCPRTPIILEGRVWEAEQVAKAFELGAYAVVIGSAVTRPHLIVQRFVEQAHLDQVMSS